MTDAGVSAEATVPSPNEPARRWPRARLACGHRSRSRPHREAARRLSRTARTSCASAPPRPAWRRLLAQFQDPLDLPAAGAVVIALVAWVVEGTPAGRWMRSSSPPSWCSTRVLGYLQEAKAEDAVAALARMTAVTSAVVRDGQVLRVPSAELVRGDLLVLGEGDAVGADARLVAAASLRVQEASLTGESEAVLKDAATLRAAGAAGRPARHGLQGHRRRAGHRSRRGHGHRHGHRDGRDRRTCSRPPRRSRRRWRRKSDASGACWASRSSSSPSWWWGPSC